ncbi:hypothetical protein K438DRAFT_1790461 [Mycena galopus ATCC 62051]|nr:hypothetical protein K438DRAFT_1790461 [Mycena galopus ATCC 62051]
MDRFQVAYKMAHKNSTSSERTLFRPFYQVKSDKTFSRTQLHQKGDTIRFHPQKGGGVSVSVSVVQGVQGQRGPERGDTGQMGCIHMCLVLRGGVRGERDDVILSGDKLRPLVPEIVDEGGRELDAGRRRFVVEGCQLVGEDLEEHEKGMGDSPNCGCFPGACMQHGNSSGTPSFEIAKHAGWHHRPHTSMSQCGLERGSPASRSRASTGARRPGQKGRRGGGWRAQTPTWQKRRGALELRVVWPNSASLEVQAQRDREEVEVDDCARAAGRAGAEGQEGEGEGVGLMSFFVWVVKTERDACKTQKAQFQSTFPALI